MVKDIEVQTTTTTTNKKKKQQKQQPQKRRAKTTAEIDADIVEVVAAPPKDELSKPRRFSTLDQVTARRVLFIPLGLTTFVCALGIILTFFYMVPLWDPVGHLYNLKIRVVVKDTGYTAGLTSVNIGEQFVQTLQTNEQTKDLFDWDFVMGSAAENYTYEKLCDEVEDEDIWVGLLFPKYYTMTMLGAYTGLIQTSVYNNPVEYIKDAAKQYATQSITDTSFTTIFDSFDLAVRQSLDKLAVASPTAPDDVIFAPVYRNTTNIHPVANMGENLGQYITCMVLWVSMLITMSLGHITYREVMTDTFKMHISVAYVSRFITAVASSFFSTLFMAIFLHGLGFPTEHGFGHLFAVLWFVALTYCGLVEVVYAYLNVFGVPFNVILLILQIVTSDGLYAYKVMVKGFQWVNAITPFAHGVRLIRFSAFDACASELGVDIGVMFVWLIVTWIIAYPGNHYHVGRKLAYKVFPTSIKGFVHFVEFLG